MIVPLKLSPCPLIHSGVIIVRSDEIRHQDALDIVTKVVRLAWVTSLDEIVELPGTSCTPLLAISIEMEDCILSPEGSISISIVSCAASILQLSSSGVAITLA